MISAVMLTTKRRWWCQALAVEQWLLQDRERDDELVIVSEDPVGLGFVHPQVRIIACAETTLPEKWNIGIEVAMHDWITFWADDDWHGLTRLRTLHKHVSDAVDIVGYDAIYYHELGVPPNRSFLYHYGGCEPHVVDGTMMFRRALWEAHPIATQATKGAASWWMVERVHEGARVQVIPQGDYVAFIHDNNISASRPRVSRHGEVLSDAYMTLLPPGFIERIVPDVFLSQIQELMPAIASCSSVAAVSTP